MPHYTFPIISGAARGRKLGFPTFNLEIPPDFQLKPGIYAAWAWLGKDVILSEVEGSSAAKPSIPQYLNTSHTSPLPSALHYGPIPTFGQEKMSLEIHLIDYPYTNKSDVRRRHNLNKSRQTRPTHLTFEPVHYLRPIKNFPNPTALTTQIQKDITQARQLLKP